MSSRDDSNPFWIAIQSCRSFARSPLGMEVELGKVAGGTFGVEMDGDGAGAGGGETTPSGALRGEAEATRSGVGAGDTGAGVKRSAGAG